MKKNANGISPVLAVVLTLLAGALALWLYKTGHVFWGVVFTLIFADFLADMILSFKSVQNRF